MPDRKALVITMDFIFIIIALGIISLTLLNIARFLKMGGISRLLSSVYIWAILLMSTTIYTIGVYNVENVFNEVSQKVVLFLRLLYGNAYIFSMIELYLAFSVCLGNQK